MKTKHEIDELKNDPNKCDCQLHMMVLTSASYRNKMDESYTRAWATFTCISCGKKHNFFTQWGLGGIRFEKDGTRIEGKIPNNEEQS